ncbi:MULTISPECIES: C4-dicarboxylate transporter DctA [unclassified Crossiella]|uniref:C4-dicarboxylate transporter DctA n=1 Tax=unclassified Crossiella TaxID=2620835 RepID=UPI001FFE4AAF|nr:MULTISPECIES: C4-dicarboxylate transporter DctA [unclassified Crossiella]MCK2236921.1 C4-dicarboxylate transporter DctA [Crossiella sp. S99.2]MCK2250589.1 C4-dicarboxylate transporter DctA [Crossiella sp. S99.1]
MVTETGPETASRTQRILSSLFLQVLVAAVLGILVGVLWPEFGAALKLLGDAFIRAIKMIIAPLVFCVVVTGIAKAGDLRSVGRIGLKALIYFEVVSTLALVLGLVLGNLVRPGDGLNVDPATLDSAAVEKKTGGAALPGVGGFLLHVVPESVIGAFADNQLLQVLLFAVLFGAALVHLGPARAPLVLGFVEQAGEVIFKIVGYVMRLAPIAVFGSLAYLIGQYGLSSLVTYGKLIGVSYGAAALFIVLLALLLRVLTGLSLWAFVRYTRAEFVLAIGTASSESVMPRMMDKLRAAGCKPEAVGLVLPTGYSFNLDGASIYLSLATLFMAQAVGIELTIGQQLTVLLVLMLTSKGMAGIPGSAFLALSATAASVGVIPAGAVALLLGADRIMDTMRVVTNLLGNCVATFVVAKWEDGLDTQAARAAFAGKPDRSL